MPWFKTDDAFWRHPKVRRLGRDRLPAVGLWELSGTWCADNVLTNVADGFVPDSQIDMWDAKHKYAKRLVEVDLWDRVEVAGEKGYLFHDWPDYNPTKASVEADREAWRAKKAAQRGKGKSPKVSPGDTPQDSPGESTEDSPGIPGSYSRSRSRSSSGGSVEGGSPEPARESAPPPRCPKHINDPDPPACGQCADARRAAERQQAARAAVDAKARRDCRWCDADGYRLRKGSRSMPVTPYVRCDHTADQLDRPEAS